MVPLKLPQEEYATQLKGSIIIQLEKCLHGTSELISAKNNSACAGFNWIFSVDLTQGDNCLLVTVKFNGALDKYGGN